MPNSPTPSGEVEAAQSSDDPPILRGFQRRYLRARANGLKAVIQVGERGITDAIVAALDSALDSHELVKVRLRQPRDKKATAGELAACSRSALCGLVGHTVILYRPDPDEPRIELPTRE